MTPDDQAGVNWFDDGDHLNERAFTAAIGLSGDWRTDIVALLRSKTPIHDLVRHALADAMEGVSSTGVKLVMRNNENLQAFAKGMETRIKWMEIGRWIKARMAEGSPRDPALHDAAEEFQSNYKTCSNALTYCNQVEAWLAAVQVKAKVRSPGRRTYLEQEYHRRHFAKLGPPVVWDPDELDRRAEALLKAIAPVLNETLD